MQGSLAPFVFAPENTKLKIVFLGRKDDEECFDRMDDLSVRGELDDAAREKLYNEAQARQQCREERAIEERRKELLASLDRTS